MLIFLVGENILGKHGIRWELTMSLGQWEDYYESWHEWFSKKSEMMWIDTLESVTHLFSHSIVYWVTFIWVNPLLGMGMQRQRRFTSSLEFLLDAK